MIEKNEVSAKARGGTELYNEFLEAQLEPSYFEKFQIIPTRVREIDPNRKAILVVHETPWDGQVQDLANPEYRKQFAGIVFVSNWQRQMFNVCLGVPFSESVVIPHGFDFDHWKRKDYSKTIRLSYHSMPNRGLEILIPVFNRITEQFPELDVHLDIYSSFNTYGWADGDTPFKELIDQGKTNPKITYHGAVSNEVLVERLKDTHIHAYPNIYAETFCRSVVESIGAGLVVVCPDYGALPDTTAKMGYMYEFTEDKNAHAERFAAALYQVIMGLKNQSEADGAQFYSDMLQNTVRAQRLYGSHVVTQKWKNYLNSLY